MLALYKLRMNDKAIKALENRLARLENAVFRKKATPAPKATSEMKAERMKKN